MCSRKAAAVRSRSASEARIFGSLAMACSWAVAVLHVVDDHACPLHPALPAQRRGIRQAGRAGTVIAHILNLRMASRQVKAIGLNAPDPSSARRAILGCRTRHESRRPGL